MFFNPKPYERMLKRFLALQAVSIDSAINNIIPTITRLVGRVNTPIAGGDFRFRDYPALSRAVDMELQSLSRQITGTITAGVEWAWDLANVKNDDMLSRIIRSIGAAFVPAAALMRWNQKNLPALEAFEHRRISGMGLSDKVWAFTKGIKGDLELALDLGLGEGKSADSLSRLIRAYLKEPNRLYRRVRDEKGVLHLSKAASNYHPGQGVYRSSYKNARRLAATETNMAYRSSDFARVQQIDFILGIEVHLSNNHTCLNAKGIPEPFYDICDELAGRYPKDFKFVGWHPLCRCYTTTILPDKDEFFEYLRQMDENGHSTYVFDGQVKEIPPQMHKWLAENEGRIANAKSLPYWIRDNQELLNMKPSTPDADADIAKALGVKKGKPMSYEDADTGRENPNYKRGVNNGYNLNCQTCTLVHELRRRGFDVTAKPNIKGSAHKAIDWQQRFMSADGNYVTEEWISRWKYDNGYKAITEKRANEFLSLKMKDAGRYEIYVKWKGRNSAHVFLAEVDKTGKIHFFDPQTGEQSKSFMDRIDKNYIGVLRIDNKIINPKAAALISIK